MDCVYIRMKNTWASVNYWLFQLWKSNIRSVKQINKNKSWKRLQMKNYYIHMISLYTRFYWVSNRLLAPTLFPAKLSD